GHNGDGLPTLDPDRLPGAAHVGVCGDGCPRTGAHHLLSAWEAISALSGRRICLLRDRADRGRYDAAGSAGPLSYRLAAIGRGVAAAVGAVAAARLHA